MYGFLAPLLMHAFSLDPQHCIPCNSINHLHCHQHATSRYLIMVPFLPHPLLLICHLLDSPPHRNHFLHTVIHIYHDKKAFLLLFLKVHNPCLLLLSCLLLLLSECMHYAIKWCDFEENLTFCSYKRRPNWRMPNTFWRSNWQKF